MSAVLEIEGLDVCYGASQVLFGMSLAVEQGATLALLGRNGAGKSTTMKAAAGFLPARAGRIRFGGRDVTGARPHVLARLGLAYVPEDRQVFPDHSVEDNLLIAAKKGPGGEDGWTVPRIWRQLPLLERLRHRAAGRLSGGEQQMLAIGRALMGNPTVLLLDEPSEGLAPIVVQAIGALLRELRAAGSTILIAEQNMHFCLGGRVGGGRDRQGNDRLPGRRGRAEGECGGPQSISGDVRPRRITAPAIRRKAFKQCRRLCAAPTTYHPFRMRGVPN